MAEEVIVNVGEPPVEDVSPELTTEIEGESEEAPEMDAEELWRGIRAALEVGAEQSRNQSDALLAMNRELEELKNRVPQDLQEMMRQQQATIQTMVSEMLATVRVNLQTQNQEEQPPPPVQPDAGEEGPPAAAIVEPPAPAGPPKSTRKRRRI